MNEAFLAAALAVFPGAGRNMALTDAPPTPPSWVQGTFAGADGTPLSYEYRPGSGPAVVLVHGLGIGADGFDGWRDFFAGRPLMILERRGYGSPIGSLNASDVGAVNQADVSASVDEALRLDGGQPVGLLGYSLGALLLTAPDPARVRWLALVCPGVPGMAADLPAAEQALAAQTRYWYGVASAGGPAARDSWLLSVVAPGVLELAATARGLGLSAAAAELTADAASPEFLNLYTEESLWAYAQTRGFAPNPGVPVFVGYAENDQVVPPAAVMSRIAHLESEGARVSVAHWPGDHLDALAYPGLVRSALESFDAGTP